MALYLVKIQLEKFVSSNEVPPPPHAHARTHARRHAHIRDTKHHRNDDGLLMFYGHFCTHARLNGLSDLQK